MTGDHFGRWLMVHERALLVIGAGAALLIATIWVLARSRAIDWPRLVGTLVPGWPWW